LLVVMSACAGDQIAGPAARPHSTALLTAGLRPCSADNRFFAGTAIAEREAWYGKQLRALEERPLCTGSTQVLESYRFTWIPSFDPAVVVRIDVTATGYQLTGKILDGAGGYEPGALARQVIHSLSDADVARFSDLLGLARFWEVPTVPRQRSLGCDGAQWVLEALSPKGYHVVDRWTPYSQGPDRQFRAVAEWMLEMSGLVPVNLVKEY